MDEDIQEQKKRLEQRLEYLSDIKKAKQDKINKIDAAIARRKPNYTPVHKGNKTMYQHLQSLKAKWEKDGDKFIQKQKEKTERSLNEVRSKLSKE